MTTAAARPAVAVTGIGMVTPAGIGREITWQRVLSGIPTAAPDPALADTPIPLSCRVPDYDPRAHRPRRVPQRLDPFTQFALTAAREAVADARLDCGTWPSARVAVVIGNCSGGLTSYETQHRKLDAAHARVSPLLLPLFLANMVAAQLSIELNAAGPSLVTATACASGTTALGTALQLLRSGACDIALAGGTEAMITPLTVTSLAAAGALTANPDPATASRPFDSRRDGFVMGEGAAVLVLERAEHARARGREGYALLAGYGASCDAHDPVTPHPHGDGAARAVQAALADAGATHDEVDHVNAHATSTPLGDLAEGRLLHRLFPARTAVTSVKGTLGHLIGAAGAVEAACTALSVHRRTVPPTAGLHTPDPALGVSPVTGAARSLPIGLALSNSFGFGGQNAVVAFRPVHSIREEGADSP
ncbi:3-oxoacyl-ACP synthase [Streptomyces spiroverticillatus]|uniref:3-oxoacyl-ACP synthase n=1 Tax=Streptomyces finlayi TaxID=67296 RepID=A0A918XA47_9ACTN|nr:beta-ketoacyl-[acyl-carrier-protein] synthase family protein [Streptomyces finlayi]GHA49574.1 3-oxoacyl-ACP synthase [Streptomyces spiroverticillatus]GHD19398.1 3-oxoacyl-ACP synthase [Streptomyces finlayi]